MKTGCCFWTSPDRFDELAKVKAAGADFIEIPLVQAAELVQEDIERLTDITASLGLPCTAANLLFPSDMRLLGKGIDYAPVTEYLWKTFDKIRGTPVRHITFGSGRARSRPEGMSAEEAAEQMLRFLADILSPVAEKYDIVCGVEALNTGESNLFTTCGEVFRTVKEVNRPHIRMIADYYHFSLENEPLESLENYRGWLSHLHIASPSAGRRAPLPADPDDYGAFLSAVRKTGATEISLSIEGVVPEPYYETLAQSLSYLKTL